MTFIEARNWFRNDLKNQYSISEIDTYFKSIGSSFFGWEPTDLGLHPDRKLANGQLDKLKTALSHLVKCRPIQYIIGEGYFKNYSIVVNESVLIPRPETEELVDWILEDYALNTFAKEVLDLGTGSGCISIALALEKKEFQLTGIDISPEALEIAQLNNDKLNAGVTFIEKSVFDLIDWEQPVDLIVSNPPYVTDAEKREMQANVLDFEPHLALFVADNDPLLHYRSILDFANATLVSEGRIYFEINPLYVNELENLISSYKNYAYVFRKDIFGKKRMLRIIKEQ